MWGRRPTRPARTSEVGTTPIAIRLAAQRIEEQRQTERTSEIVERARRAAHDLQDVAQHLDEVLDAYERNTRNTR